MNLVQEFEKKQLATLKREIPEFGVGDTLKVWFKIKETKGIREQAFEGTCIGRRNRGLNSSVKLLRVAHGESVERIFPLYSPNVRIEVVKRGVVRRAKIYYLRNLSGKRARIRERIVAKGKKTTTSGK